MSNLAFDLFTPDGIQTANSFLDAGEVIALPTDTVAGLVVGADSVDGALKLTKLKGGDSSKPFTWHLGDLQTLQGLSPNLAAGIHPWLLEALQQQCTVLLPSSMLAIPPSISWQFDKVGLRWPQNIDFLNVAQEYGKLLLATSINSTGQPPLYGGELLAWLEQRQIPYAAQLLDMDGDSTPSTLIDVLPKPTVLRGDEAMADNIGLSILVICTGNSCRSPLGAELLKIEIASSWQVNPEQLSDFGFNIESAGTFAMDGQQASKHSQLVASEIGIDLSEHSSQALGSALDKQWDIVLGMSHNHLAALPSKMPAALFDLSGKEIDDPFGADVEQYRATRDQLQAAAQQWVAELSSWPQT